MKRLYQLLCRCEGRRPVMLPSHHFVGNPSVEEQLELFYEGYRKSLKHLYD